MRPTRSFDDEAKVRVLDPSPGGVSGGTPAPQAPRSGRRGTFPVVGVAVLVTVVAGAALLGRGRPPATEVEDSPSVAVTDPPGRVRAATPAPIAPPVALDWGPQAGGTPANAIIEDVAVVDGVYMAVGSRAGVPAAWRSIDGVRWTGLRVDSQSDEGSMLMIARGAGRAFALGVVDGRTALWLSPQSGDPGWSGPTIEPELSAASPTAAMAFFDEWMVIGRQARSNDSTVWVGARDRGWSVAGTIPGRVAAVTTIGETAVAVGSECADALCPPAIWASTDGSAWTQIDVSALTGGATGELRSIVEQDGVLIAVGAVATSTGSRALIWRSFDGVAWREPFRRSGTELAMRVTALGLPLGDEAPTAELEIAGDRFEVVQGTVFDTVVGDVTIDSISRDGVSVRFRCVPLRLPVGTCRGTVSPASPLVIGTPERAVSVASLGGRIVVGGVAGDDDAVVWASKDGGATWERIEVDAAGVVDGVAARASDVTAIVTSSDGSRPIRAGWSTRQEVAVAIDDVERFVSAIYGGRGDGRQVLRLLTEGGRSSVRIAGLPGVGPVIPDWLTVSGTRVSGARVERTLDYVRISGVDVTLRGCSGTHDFVTDLSRVSCAYAARSDLLDALGVPSLSGTMVANVIEGGIRDLTVTGNESHPLLGLADWVAWTRPGDFAPTFGSETPEGLVVDPVMSRTAAIRTRELADLYAAEVAGETRLRAETPFGEMDLMPWGTSGPPGGAPLADIAYTGEEFLALSSGAAGSTTLRRSLDGSVWTEAGRFPVDHDGQLLATGSRTFIDPGGAGDLLEWVDGSYQPITVETLDGALPRLDMAATRHGMTLIVGYLEDWTLGVWRVEAGAHAAELVSVAVSPMRLPSVVATSDSFVIVDRASGVTLRTSDGVTFEEAATLVRPGRDVVRSIWSVGDTIYAVTSIDPSCVPGGEDAVTACRTLSSTWALAPGATWKQIETPRLDMTFAGPLGLVAAGHALIDYAGTSGPLLASRDGIHWDRLGFLYPWRPDTAVLDVAVGADRMLLTIADGSDQMLLVAALTGG